MQESSHKPTSNSRAEVPAFLHMLGDGETKSAGEAFAQFAMKVLTVAPPRILSAFPVDERDDVIQDVLLHFWEDDQRRLRSFRPEGRPFINWFYTVAWNKMRTLLRRRTTEPSVELVEERWEAVAEVNLLGELELEEEWSVALECVLELSTRDQLLVWLWANGVRPRHMPPVLGEPGADPKVLADRTLYVLKKELPKRLRDRSRRMGEKPIRPAEPR